MLQEYLSLGIMQRRHFSLEQINSAVDFMQTLTCNGKRLWSISYRCCGYVLRQAGKLVHATSNVENVGVHPAMQVQYYNAECLLAVGTACARHM